jgi:NAD(P)-dependent dehydrogenase (short-subunit alcohol dehydrogenase family)
MRVLKLLSQTLMLVSSHNSNGRPFAYCTTGKAQGVAESINKSGGSAIAVPGDMLDAEYLKTLVKKAAEFGNGKIHIIVNNAG